MMPEKAPRWDLMRTEGWGGGEVFLGMVLVVWEYMRIYRRKIEVRGHREAHKEGGVPYPLGRPPHPCNRLVALLTCTQSHLGVFWTKKNHHEVLFRLDTVWYYFSVKLKNKEKTETGTRIWVNKLVPEII